jgi:hypothetical protein
VFRSQRGKPCEGSNPFLGTLMACKSLIYKPFFFCRESFFRFFSLSPAFFDTKMTHIMTHKIDGFPPSQKRNRTSHNFKKNRDLRHATKLSFQILQSDCRQTLALLLRSVWHVSRYKSNQILSVPGKTCQSNNALGSNQQKKDDLVLPRFLLLSTKGSQKVAAAQNPCPFQPDTARHLRQNSLTSQNPVL